VHRARCGGVANVRGDVKGKRVRIRAGERLKSYCTVLRRSRKERMLRIRRPVRVQGSVRVCDTCREIQRKQMMSEKAA
jgi:hypothetical protein